MNDEFLNRVYLYMRETVPVYADPQTWETNPTRLAEDAADHFDVFNVPEPAEFYFEIAFEVCEEYDDAFTPAPGEP